MLNETPGHQRQPDRQEIPVPDENQDDYVGAPSEFADAEEVPGWIANLVKAIVFIPSALATLIGLQIALVVLLLACVLIALAVFALV